MLQGEFEALQRVQEEQEEALRRRERELTALRGALEDEISAHATDLQTLQEQQQQEIHRLLEATDQAKEARSSQTPGLPTHEITQKHT